MKIDFNKFDKFKQQFEWLASELLSSVDGEEIHKANKLGEYDFKLLINGREFEPKMLTLLFENFKTIVENEAKQLVKEKFEEAELEANKLLDLLKEAKYNIIEKYRLEEEELDN